MQQYFGNEWGQGKGEGGLKYLNRISIKNTHSRCVAYPHDQGGKFNSRQSTSFATLKNNLNVFMTNLLKC